MAAGYWQQYYCAGPMAWLWRGVQQLVLLWHSALCDDWMFPRLCRYLMAMQHKRKFPVAVANVSAVMEGDLRQNP